MQNIQTNHFKQYFELRQSLFFLFSKLFIAEFILTISHILIGKIFMSNDLHNTTIGSLNMQTGELIIFHIINIIIIFIIISNRISNYYVINDKEVSSSTGMLKKYRKAYDIKGIQGISFSQSFWGRIFNYGTIQLENPLIKGVFQLKNISKPTFYSKLIREECDNASKTNSLGKIIPIDN